MINQTDIQNLPHIFKSSGNRYIPGARLGASARVVVERDNPVQFAFSKQHDNQKTLKPVILAVIFTKG